MIYKDNEQPSGVSDQFFGSSSGTTATLMIHGVQAVDEADCYCLSLYNDDDLPQGFRQMGK